MIGARAERLEDARLLRGEGCFVDDLDLPNQLHAAVLRSPHAHARITQMNTSAARALTGVQLVLVAADLGRLAAPLPMLLPHPALEQPRTHVALAADTVRYVGEPIAFVVADSRYRAEDARELIEVEYEPLPTVSHLGRASTPDVALVHPELGTNVAGAVRMHVGDVERAFAEAPFRFEEHLVIDRGAGCPIETRGVLAQWTRDGLTLWASTQMPVPLRNRLAALFELSLSQIRVVAPDVGGGFGPKGMTTYPEEILVPFAARRLDRPVKWIEDRLEHMVATNQEREQIHDAAIAVAQDGTVLAVRDTFQYDAGAYIPYGLNVPNVTAVTIPGPYHVPNYAVEYRAVYTNRTIVSPYRGAGRPHAVFVMERLLDRAARELGIDRVEIRRRNLIQPDEFPYDVGLIYQDGAPLHYDSGDYPQLLEVALERIDWPEALDLQRRARADGRLVGVGVACYVEGTGYRSYEGARVLVEPSGRVVLMTGGASQGQGHSTMLAQVVGEVFDIDPAAINVVAGDTAQFTWGLGTWASRAAVVTANAAERAARIVRQKALEAAAQYLEVQPGDLELSGGRVGVRGAPARAISLAELAANVGLSRNDTTMGDAPGLDATQFFSPPQATFAAGVHATMIEVEPTSGLVDIQRYVVAHDCGRRINPAIVDGQIHGGVAQGIGNTFLEQLRYGPDGQLLTTTFMDYLLPTACDVPPMSLAHLETPSTTNPLGVKGVGEAGAIPVPALMASALEDALSPLHIHVTRMPVGPAEIADAIARAQRDGASVL